MPRQKQSAHSRRAADRDPDRDGLEDRPSLTLFDDDEDYDSAEDLVRNQIISGGFLEDYV